MKLNEAGTGLLYATFLGGFYNDEGYSIAVDGSGAAYVTGSTRSDDFPTGPGYDTSFDGDSGIYGDAFVVKLNEAGTGLLYATFLGGSSYEYGFGIAVDGASNAYVTGSTRSDDFPTGPGYDTSLNGGVGDAFVVKLATGSSVTTPTATPTSTPTATRTPTVTNTPTATVMPRTYVPLFLK